MGAKLTADLLRENCITKNEADYLLTISNNASPMFLMAYILNQLLHTQRMVILFICINIRFGFSMLHDLQGRLPSFCSPLFRQPFH